MLSSPLAVPLRQCLTTFGFENLERLGQNRTAFLNNLGRQGAKRQHHSVGEVLDEYRRIEENSDKSGFWRTCVYNPFFYQVTQAAKELGLVRDDDTAFSRVVYPQPKADLIGELLVTWGYAPNFGRYIFRSRESEKDRVDLVFQDALLIGALLLKRSKQGFDLHPVARDISLDELADILSERAWPLYVGSEKFPVHGIDFETYEMGLHDVGHDISWSLWGGETYHQDAVFFYGHMKRLLGDGNFSADERHSILDSCLTGPATIVERRMKADDFYTEYVSTIFSRMSPAESSPILAKLEPLLSGHPRRDLWLRPIREYRSLVSPFLARRKAWEEARAKKSGALHYEIAIGNEGGVKRP